MTASESPLSYADIREVADRALANGFCVLLKCHDHGNALSERSRFYKMRELDRKESRQTYPKGDPHHGVSVYDRLVVSPCVEGEQQYLSFQVSSAARLEERIVEL